MAVALALPLSLGTVAELSAQETEPDSQVIDAITTQTIAYIETGNEDLDRLSAAGLYGLARETYRRTSLENFYVSDSGGSVQENTLATGQLRVAGVDPEHDDLSVYPFIYWPMDPGQPALSDQAIENLNNYMDNGGLLFIDTRDQVTQNAGNRRLRLANDNGLDIPTLQALDGCSDAEEDCHVLGKSFYLLAQFPGRYSGSSLWVERTEDYRPDGVSRVIIGGNDWASAWAIDGEGQPVFPVSDTEQREEAYRVGVNALMYALTGNYKSDLIHTPAILERLDR